MDRAEKDKKHEAIVALNNEITKHASRKELTAAMQLFDRAIATDGANTHTFAIALNCNVRCGNLHGAASIYEKMKTYKKGIKPTDVICTTMLKGYCEQGNINKALTLFEEMKQMKVEPNIRTVNTFLRGCVLVGAIDEADQMIARMQRDFQIAPDVSSWEYLVILLCQGLKLDKVLPLVGRLKGDRSMWPGLAAMQVKIAVAASLLGDLKCSRKAIASAKEALQLEEKEGSALYHITNDEGLNDDDDADDVEGYQREATGGKRAWKTESESSRVESLEHFRQHKRSELRLDIANIESFIEKRQKAAGDQNKDYLLPYFKRLISFPAAGDDAISSTSDDIIDKLVNATRHRFGLETYMLRLAGVTAPKPKSPAPNPRNKDKKKRLHSESVSLVAENYESLPVSWESSVPAGILQSATAFRESFSRCFDASKRIDFSRIFCSSCEDKIIISTKPVKLEICSGAGEWAVAQANADPESNWVTMELRHDRVNQTFTRAVCAEATNLCVIGGDATQIIPNHLAANSFDNIFINHPEPPQQTGRGETSEGKHLLTADFFMQIARILVPNGMLLIVTDNLWYANFLLRLFAGMPSAPRTLMGAVLEKKPDSRWSIKDSDQGINLYTGRPGNECGVCAEASSYFDRLWNRVQIEDRYFLALRKNSQANSSIHIATSATSSGATLPSKSLKKIKKQGLVVESLGKKIKFE